MATSTSLFNTTRFTALATGDVVAMVDVSDTTQSAHGSVDSITITNFFATIPAPINVTSASATALAVGLNGATNPAFTVDASTALQVAGCKVTGAVTGGTVALVATDSGSNTNITFNAKGSGTIGIGSVSTGRVTITPVTTIVGSLTLSAALVYGGVTLSNAVTGTGNMVLSAGPTLTGTIVLTGTTITGAPTWSSNQAITLSTAAQPNVTSVGTLTGLGIVSPAVANRSLTVGYGSTAHISLLNQAGNAATFLNEGGASGLNAFQIAPGGSVKFTLTGAGQASFAGAVDGITSLTISAGLNCQTSAISGITTLSGNGAVSGFTSLALSSTITTGAPTGGAGAWKLGIANAVSPTSPNRTVTIDIGGTLYYLAAKTTND